MASAEFESLDEEVKELLQNYRYKKATAYEPCTLKNYKECLIGLNEQLSLFNINYIFNPHTDVNNNTIHPEALVKLINSMWTLLQHHKSYRVKTDRLTEQNHVLEQTNKQLATSLVKLKDRLNTEKKESGACVASAQRVSDQSNEVYRKLLDTRAKLNQLTKQKETNDKSLHNKIAKLQIQNDKLLDRLRNNPESYTPCADICNSTVMQLKERDRKNRAVIAQLQASNQDLIREVLALKEKIILEGINDMNLDNNC